jgi:two-component system, OmpR family, sensor histidine kinase TctE
MKPGEHKNWTTQKRPWWRLDSVWFKRAPVDPVLPTQKIIGSSLFGQILDFMLAPLLIVWPISIAITFFVAHALADRPYDQAMIERVQVIAQQVRIEQGKLVITLPAPAAAILRADEEDEVHFQVVDPKNNIVAGDAAMPRPDPEQVSSTEQVHFRNEVIQGRENRIAAYRFAIAERSTGSYLIQVSETLNKRSALASSILKGVILPQIIILPLSVFLVWIGLKRGLKPLTRLQDKVRARDHADLSPFDTKNVPAEIEPLVETFNELLERFEYLLRTQRHFIADAAHQLKTPLAGLQTQAELALRQQGDPHQQQTLRQLARSTKRTARLVSQLLALARAEHQRTALSLARLNLTELARETTAEWVSDALDKNIDLGFETIDAHLFVAGHSLLLREMLNNLIDNALRYTPGGGQITVRVSNSGMGRVKLEVEDDGPGISTADQARVFDRFYRVLGDDPPTTQDPLVDGSGLGLAIVKEIAEQHGATIRLNSFQAGNPDQMPHGTRLVIEFPS